MKKVHALLLLSTLALGILTHCSGGGETDSSTPDTTAPEVGSTITFSGIATTGVTANWGAATDDTSAVEKLKYCLVYSSADITSLDDAAGATIAQTYAENITSANAVNLTAGTTYYFSVIVKDEAGNKALYQAQSVTTASIVSSEAKISAFSINGVAATIDDDAETITLSGLSCTSDLTNLTVSFTASAGASVSINGTTQLSGITANSFTGNVTYTVTAEDGTTVKTYTVSVTKNEGVSFVIHFRPANWNGAIDLTTFKAYVNGTEYPMPLDSSVTTWTVSNGKEGWYSTSTITIDKADAYEFYLSFNKIVSYGGAKSEIYSADSTATVHNKISAEISNGHIWVDRFTWKADASGTTPGYCAALAGKVYATATAPNDVPSVSVSLSGTGQTGETLTAVTTYSDSEDDPISDTVYRWLGASAIDGEFSTIADATASTYTPTDMTYNYIKVEATLVTSGSQPAAALSAAKEISDIPPFAVIDGTKDASWSTVTPISDGVDAWAYDGTHTADPCGFDFSNVYIANNANKLYIAIELSSVTWGAKDVQIFLDNISNTNGATDFGSGSSASWSWGDKNVVFDAGVSIEGLAHLYSSGMGIFTYGSSLPLTQNNSVAEYKRSADNTFIEFSIRLDSLGLNPGDTVNIGITASNSYYVPCILDSAFDGKLAEPQSDQAITMKSYIIQ